MNSNESKIHHYLEHVKNKSITLITAAELLQLSYRQTKRLWKEYRAFGVKGLISKKRGVPSNRKIPDKHRSEIAQIITRKYPDFKPEFATEMLREHHGIMFSSETIRLIMIEYKIWFPRKGKGVVHQRRSRRLCVGELVQTDASDHLWFEDRGPRCHLYIIIDDATSEIIKGYFELEETTKGYFTVFEMYFREKGLPLSIYCDKRGTFKVNQGKKKNLTQFGRAMKELGIEIIYAHSPQAKGRVERAFKTLQDRLIREMRLNNISTIDEGNAYFPTYLAKHNLKYGIAPANPHNAHLPLKNNKALKYILCNKYQRIVSKNLEVNFDNKIYQIHADKESNHLRNTKIDVIETMKGEIYLEHRGKKIQIKGNNESLPVSLPKVIKFTDFKTTDATNKRKRFYQSQRLRRYATFSKQVRDRGYHEREELLTKNEKSLLDARLGERRKLAREENEEIRNERLEKEGAL
ncbi:MAG: ISNCY family transposase [Parachlamydiaceae bacterium]|nr:ISNCY family transposase [Parachlamydiaceae bacterium]MBA3978467.1 ISNCY family transposase [Nitrosopumilus sp.]